MEFESPTAKGGFKMKYIKPEIKTVIIETQPIASAGLNAWLDNTEFSGTDEYITDWLVSAS